MYVLKLVMVIHNRCPSTSGSIRLIGLLSKLEYHPVSKSTGSNGVLMRDVVCLKKLGLDERYGNIVIEAQRLYKPIIKTSK